MIICIHKTTNIQILQCIVWYSIQYIHLLTAYHSIRTMGRFFSFSSLFGCLLTLVCTVQLSTYALNLIANIYFNRIHKTPNVHKCDTIYVLLVCAFFDVMSGKENLFFCVLVRSYFVLSYFYLFYLSFLFSSNGEQNESKRKQKKAFAIENPIRRSGPPLCICRRVSTERI